MNLRPVMVVGLASLFLLTGLAMAKAADVKIGVVDMQYVLNNSETGKKAKEAFNQKLEEKKKEISGKEEELKKLKDELDKKGAKMTPTVRKKKEEAFQKQLGELQAMAQTGQQWVSQEEEKMAAPVISSVLKMVQERGQKEGFTLILEKSRGDILYMGQGVDLTEETIKQYNTEAPKAAEAAPPAEPATPKKGE